MRALKRKALESNKNFLNDINICNNRTAYAFKTPPSQIGFRLVFENRKPYSVHLEHDPRGQVSLALVNKNSSILKLYSDKLNVFTINVARFYYTVEAFAFRNNQSDETFPITTQALTFYVETDLKYCSVDVLKQNRAIKNNITSKMLQEDATAYDILDDIKPNEQFSEILHKFKSNGYMEYIFDLAREIRLNVDLVFNETIIARYLLDSGTETDPAIGFLTVRNHVDQWYVKTSKDPLFTNNNAIDITSIQTLKNRPRERFKYKTVQEIL